MDEPDLSELILQMTDADDEEQLNAYVEEFERRLAAGHELSNDAVDLLVQESYRFSDDAVDLLIWVLRRRPSLVSEAHKRRLNLALRSAGFPVIFDATEMADRIRQAASAGVADQMRACYDEFEDLALGLEGFPEGSVDVIVQLLGEPGFRGTNYSHFMLYFLIYRWIFEKFNEGEKERLLPALEAAYGEFADWMSCFVISEGLGECYPDERGLAVLRRLMHVPGEMHRSLVPHALEHLVRAAEDPRLKARAEAELRSMENDPSEQGRYEAAVSRARLAFRSTGGRVPPKEKKRRPKKESRAGHNERKPPR